MIRHSAAYLVVWSVRAGLWMVLRLSDVSKKATSLFGGFLMLHGVAVLPPRDGMCVLNSCLLDSVRYHQIAKHFWQSIKLPNLPCQRLSLSLSVSVTREWVLRFLLSCRRLIYSPISVSDSASTGWKPPSFSPVVLSLDDRSTDRA